MEIQRSTKWQILPVPDDEGQSLILRLNALGSLYFFEKFVLQKGRLVEHLHKPICETLERQNVNFMLELPRDHFKTTCVTEGLPIWWALPFDDRDEAAMRELGYGDEWIRWMRWAHNPGIRILTISENVGNAARMGIRIDKHFESNSRFRDLFPEIMPTTKSVWNSESKSVTNAVFHSNGEGTFDYLGVGGALQSRHYERMIEDDLVGRAAAKSDTLIEDVIEYHKLVEGAFDGPERTQIVVGNRWSPFDLNGWIRDNDPDFIIESHSALGGCCDLHPPGMPIFPEEFSVERLERIRRVQGPYLFSHQYLNQALMADEVVFNPAWLRYYSPQLATDGSKRMMLTHEAVEGSVVKDTAASWLHRVMIVDPNHAGADGRAHHAILVIGFHPETDNFYLLDVWAKSMSYDDLMSNVYKMAERWKMTEFWLETVAAQKYLKYHIEYRNKIEKRRLRVRELKTERSKNAKWTRIDSLAPLFEQGKFYVRRDQSAFLDEYCRYTHSTRYPVDVLDGCGYIVQVVEPIRTKEFAEKQRQHRDKMMGKRNVAGY
jgi:terminase large subunit-like protein